MNKQIYVVYLKKIVGIDGAFPCPKCGSIISPDDESEEVYQVISTKNENDGIDELILQCNICKSKIKLILSNLSEKESKTL